MIAAYEPPKVAVDRSLDQMGKQSLLVAHEGWEQIQYTTRICPRLCTDSVRPYLKAPPVKPFLTADPF